MIKYTQEDGVSESHIYLIDEDYALKIPVAVVFDLTHARIIVRKLNEYIGNKAQIENG